MIFQVSIGLSLPVCPDRLYRPERDGCYGLVTRELDLSGSVDPADQEENAVRLAEQMVREAFRRARAAGDFQKKG